MKWPIVMGVTEQADYMATEGKNPIIIIGAPRSGTTFLGDVLSQHPQLHYMIEPNPMWKRFVRNPSDMVSLAGNESAVRQTQEIFQKALARSGKAWLLEKTPQNCLRFPFVRAVFPDAKFIHIIRNGEESTFSIAKFWETNTRGITGVRIGQRLKEMNLRQAPYYASQLIKRVLPAGKAPRVFWGPVLPGMDGIVKELSIPEVAALQWRTCVELACHYGRSLPTDQYMELKLEDWGPEQMRRIIDFSDLADADLVMDAFMREYDPNKASHRKKAASEEERALIRPWIGSTMQWLGQA